MKANWIACGVAVLLQVTAAKGSDRAFQPGLAIGGMQSASFSDYMRDAYETDSSRDTFGAICLSAKMRMNDHWSVVPSATFFWMVVSISETDSFAAAVLKVRYSLWRDPTVFLQAGPNYSFATSGLGASGSVGGEFSIGYTLKEYRRLHHGPEFEVGYRYLPAHPHLEESDHYPNRDRVSSTVDFGGPFLMIGFRF